MKQLRGKRKLIAVLSGLAIFFIIMLFIIFFLMPIPSGAVELSALGTLAQLLATAIGTILVIFVGGNVLNNFKKDESNNNS